jgi:hypothetical protein
VSGARWDLRRARGQLRTRSAAIAERPGRSGESGLLWQAARGRIWSSGIPGSSRIGACRWPYQRRIVSLATSAPARPSRTGQGRFVSSVIISRSTFESLRSGCTDPFGNRAASARKASYLAHHTVAAVAPDPNIAASLDGHRQGLGHQVRETSRQGRGQRTGVDALRTPLGRLPCALWESQLASEVLRGPQLASKILREQPWLRRRFKALAQSPGSPHRRPSLHLGKPLLGRIGVGHDCNYSSLADRATSLHSRWREPLRSHQDRVR